MAGAWFRARWINCAWLLAALLVAACDDAATPAPAAAPPPTVTVISVSEREIVGEANFVGRIEAVAEVELRARITGFLEEILVTDGQDVREGDLLFLIEAAPFQANVELARANVAKAQANVDETKAQLDRSQTLFDKGDLTTARLEQDRSAYRQAAAQLLAEQAQLRQAEIELSYTSIVAPIAGRVGASAFSVGALVDATSDPLTDITSLDPIYVTFSINENVMLQVKRARLEMGLDATFEATDGIETLVVPRLRLPDGSIYERDGVIDFIDSKVDLRTGTIGIRAVFPNPDQLLSPGQFVTVIVADEEPTRAITVPQASVQRDKDGPFVLVVDADNQVAQRRITTSGTDGTDYVVTSGLVQGETVIVQGILKVRPGVAVNPVFDAGNAGG
jgi:membrane fusion protein (multidrug efflux system)